MMTAPPNVSGSRQQQTLAQPAEVSGFGLFGGQDVVVRFQPAAENTGIVFQRVDLPGAPTVPARLEYVIARPRRTTIRRGAAIVEMIEHTMAALCGMQIDNCIVQIDAPEPPGGDGSSLQFVTALQAAGIVRQSAKRQVCCVSQSVQAQGEGEGGDIQAGPINQHGLVITYALDYGPRSPIRPQNLTVLVTPELFVSELAHCRTFVLEAETAALRAQGYGLRATEQNLLIFGEHGVLGNTLRAPDECARHKILDCIGDFGLLGCDLRGHFRCFRSGHALNHAICRGVQASTSEIAERRAA